MNTPFSITIPAHGARRVQKYERTQDWRSGPFRSSSPRGEPQIWGGSEAMSAIRVPRTRRENTIQQRDTTLPGGDLDPGRAAPGPERASPLCLGSPGLDSGPLGWPLFRCRTAPVSAHSPIWRKRGTRKSGLETNAENEARSALLARLW